MSCIRLCQELETPEEKANIIPISNERENNEKVIKIDLIRWISCESKF